MIDIQWASLEPNKPGLKAFGDEALQAGLELSLFVAWTLLAVLSPWKRQGTLSVCRYKSH